jgi:hypothetical protein
MDTQSQNTQETQGETVTQGETRQGEPAQGRLVGGETLVTRIFRELSIRHLAESGRLEKMREEFVALVEGHPSVRRTDRAYAVRYADDMTTALLSLGISSTVPAPVAPVPVPTTPVAPVAAVTAESDEINLDDLLSGYMVAEGHETDDFLSTITSGPQNPLDGIVAPGGPLHAALEEFRTSAKKEHPFLRVFPFGGARYVALGTIMGVIPDGAHAGKQMSAHMTVVPHRRFRDVPEDIAPTLGGRQISVSPPAQDSLRKFVFLIRHKPGLKIRWWLRVGDRDEPKGVRFVELTDDAKGWRPSGR